MAAVLLSLTAAGSWATPANNVFDAATIDDLRDVRKLLTAGVDAKGLDEHGDTLLIVATRNDAGKVLEFLLADPTTDVEATNISNENALMIAAFRNKPDAVDRLIKRGAEVNRVGWTPLHYAASVGSSAIVARLLDESAYIDAPSPNRTTPLMMAARGSFEALCHQLVEAGADPTPVNERDLTASDFAKRAGNESLAAWLAAQADAWRAKYGTARDPTRTGQTSR